MEERMSPATALRAWVDHAPQLLNQLPQLPQFIAGASSKIRRIENDLSQQRALIAQLQANAEKLSGRKARRLGGITLMLAASVLLWEPLMTTWQSQINSAGQFATGAGLLSAVLGVLMLLRA